MAALIGLWCSTLLCNKWRVVKNERKENGSSFLSVNIKDTAGCSVLIKQVSVHKQLINKSRPSPPPDVFACLFHFTTGQCYTTAPPEWPQVFIMRTAAAAIGTMTQLWHSLTRHGLVFRATFGVSWHISGTDSAHGKKSDALLSDNSDPPVSVQDVMSPHGWLFWKHFSLNGRHQLCPHNKHLWYK